MPGGIKGTNARRTSKIVPKPKTRAKKKALNFVHTGEQVLIVQCLRGVPVDFIWE